MTVGARWDSDEVFARAAEVPTTNPVTYFGATGDGVTDDSQAFRDANDAAHDSGQGGIATVPAGNYRVKNVQLYNHVTLLGSTGAVLLDADPTSALAMVSAHSTGTTGTITTGSTTLTVASATNIEVGSNIMIQGAAGASTQQYTVLAGGGIDASTATVVTTSTLSTDWPTSGYLICGTEILHYTGRSSASFTGCTRGQFGTTAAIHAGGATISMTKRQFSEVTAVSGTTITILDPAPLGVTSATVSIGGLDAHILGLTMSGLATRYGTDGPNPFPINLALARRSSVQRCTIYDTDHGAIGLSGGTSQCRIAHNTLYDQGRPAAFLGAGIWIFSNCRGNRVVDNTFAGDSHGGIFIDDRSTTAQETDGPCVDNIVANNTFDFKPNIYTPSSIVISGSHRNVINGNTFRNIVGTAINFIRSNQGPVEVQSANNVVTGNVIDNCGTGVALTGNDNVVSQNTITNCTYPILDTSATYGGSGNITGPNTGWVGAVLVPQPRHVYADAALTPSLAYRYHAWSPTASRSIAAPVGTAVAGQAITFDITNAGASAITPTWNAIYKPSTPLTLAAP